MYEFADKTELLTHARGIVEQAVNSLWRDVKNCLKNEIQPAPFPAVLFCFSTVNLLGALVTGQAHKHADDTKISIYYMTCFMHYSNENATILIDLFRHKLVHLAQPSPLIRYGSEKITWQHHHHDKQFHLKKEPIWPIEEIDDIPSDWHIEITHRFHISIMDFATDIKESAMGPDGYFDRLESSPYLQANYELAINQMYGEPTNK